MGFSKNQYWIILNILLISTGVFAQKEGNIWYFGNMAGLDFNSEAPVALTDGVMNTVEGSSAISDAMGNLLFYTDGVKVWNKVHEQMPNGFDLMGHSSSTQSALIVQQPGSNNIYYIFTTPAPYVNKDSAFRYSIVDITLQGGLGDVTTKNVLLYHPTTEKLTAIRHSDGCGIWIISHKWESDEFYVYLLDNSGVSATPVVSNIGHIHEGYSTNTIGQLKASPDGSKLALAIWLDQIVELFDFDNTTGVISNPVSFPPEIDRTYGLEFSPDGTKLYATSGGPNPFFGIWDIIQWDLMAGSPIDIIGSHTIIAYTTAPAYALQLGPDGKIYCSVLGNYLAAINDPNALGIACNYVDSDVYLGGKRTALGLPTFMSSHFYPQFEIT